MRSVALLATLVVLAPIVLAVGPIEATLTLPGSLRLEGEARMSSAGASLDLTPAVKSGVLPELAWTAATGRLVETRWIPSPTRAALAQPSDNTTLDIPEGRLDSISCREGCRVVAFGVGEESSLAVRGALRGPLERLAADQIEWAEFSDGPREDAFWRLTPAGSPLIDNRGPQELAAHGTGPLGLFIKNATLRLSTEDGVRVVDARGDTSTTLMGHPVTTATAFVELRFDHASLALAEGVPFVWMAPRVDLRLDGLLEADAASGVVRVDGRSLHLREVDVRFTGTIDLGLDGAADASDGATALRASMTGRVDTFDISGADAAGFSVPPVLGLAAALMALVALARFAPLALYTRLARDDLLENDNRRRIFTAVQAKPGIHASELAARLALSRVVVQHHLTHLENHAYVRSRKEGRARVFVAAEASNKEQAVLVHVALRNKTRRRILDALDSGDWLSRREIAERSGVPESTVSYHMPRLLDSRLITARSGTPQRYARGEEVIITTA